MSHPEFPNRWGTLLAAPLLVIFESVLLERLEIAQATRKEKTSRYAASSSPAISSDLTSRS